MELELVKGMCDTLNKTGFFSRKIGPKDLVNFRRGEIDDGSGEGGYTFYTVSGDATKDGKDVTVRLMDKWLPTMKGGVTAYMDRCKGKLERMDGAMPRIYYADGNIPLTIEDSYYPVRSLRELKKTEPDLATKALIGSFSDILETLITLNSKNIIFNGIDPDGMMLCPDGKIRFSHPIKIMDHLEIMRDYKKNDIIWDTKHDYKDTDAVWAIMSVLFETVTGQQNSPLVSFGVKNDILKEDLTPKELTHFLSELTDTYRLVEKNPEKFSEFLEEEIKKAEVGPEIAKLLMRGLDLDRTKRISLVEAMLLWKQYEKEGKLNVTTKCTEAIDELSTSFSIDYKKKGK
ncbi:MAG: hypothetical protein LBI29_03965 [Rickettsiales bacterium]|jgi:hypothetical protein|nr:hypothetical protein [Rickettsiales bacterium]